MTHTKCRSSSACDLEKYLRKVRDALEVRANSLAVPREKDLDRILRYETANERALTRALDRLERLQRLRKGEYVPAPPSVFPGGDAQRKLGKLKTVKTKPRSSLFSVRLV